MLQSRYIIFMTIHIPLELLYTGTVISAGELGRHVVRVVGVF